MYRPSKDKLQEAAAEVYQCAGTLLSDAGRFDSKQGLMLLDLLSWMSGNRKKRPNTDKLLPFESAEKICPSCKNECGGIEIYYYCPCCESFIKHGKYSNPPLHWKRNDE